MSQADRKEEPKDNAIVSLGPNPFASQLQNQGLAQLLSGSTTKEKDPALLEKPNPQLE